MYAVKQLIHDWRDMPDHENRASKKREIELEVTRIFFKEFQEFEGIRFTVYYMERNGCELYLQDKRATIQVVFRMRAGTGRGRYTWTYVHA